VQAKIVFDNERANDDSAESFSTARTPRFVGSFDVAGKSCASCERVVLIPATNSHPFGDPSMNKTTPHPNTNDTANNTFFIDRFFLMEGRYAGIFVA
jgi:hypothetical protein